MNNLTVDQLKELLQIQKEFDDRIPTLNLRDSKIAYVVEFFEWFNTLETFKNWKKKPGKPLNVQLDELADMLAFGLSIANQVGVSSEEMKEAIESSFKNTEFHKMFNFKDKEFAQDAVVQYTTDNIQRILSRPIGNCNSDRHSLQLIFYRPTH